jgi:hypothetical protein
MGPLDLLTHRKFKREAQKITDRIALAYPGSLALQPDAEEHLVFKSIYLAEMGYQSPPEQSKDVIDTCCETVNGLSYLLALEFSSLLRSARNLTILQFTKYLDTELESLGFPRQSLEQKEEILKALKLDITNWKKWDETMR